MAFTTGLELVNNELAFAEHQNVELMAARGNQVVSGVGVTALSPTPDLTVDVASGNVLAGGVVVAVGASAAFPGVAAGANVLFSTLQASLTSGQAVFVFIHVDSSGVITNTDGTPAAAGQQLPPDVPEDEVILAMLTLSEGDTTIDSVDIEDWRINVPKGGYFAGIELTIANANARLTLIETDATTDNKRWDILIDAETINFRTVNDANSVAGIYLSASRTGTVVDNVSIINGLLTIDSSGLIKNPVDNAGFYTGAGDDLRMYHDGTTSRIDSLGHNIIIKTGAALNLINDIGGQFGIRDLDDANATLFLLDTTARTLTVGAAADTIATAFNGNLIISSGYLKTSPWNFISTTYSDYNMPIGWNILANSGATNNVLIANTHGSAGYSYIMPKINGVIEFHAYSGAVTAGNVASAKRLEISPTTLTSFINHDFSAGIDVTGLITTSLGIGLDASVLTFATGASGLATFGGGVTVTGDVLPATTGLYDLGSASLEWEQLFVQDRFFFSSPPVITGTTASFISGELTQISSSAAYKRNIDYPQFEPKGISFINDLTPATWEFKDYDKLKIPASEDMGFIAEDYEALVIKHGFKKEWAMHYDYPRKEDKTFDLEGIKILRDKKSTFHEAMVVMAIQEITQILRDNKLI